MGPVLGAALVVLLEDYLATAGFDGIGIVTGAVVGTVRDLVRGRPRVARPIRIRWRPIRPGRTVRGVVDQGIGELAPCWLR